jgi:hypothetical protein
VNRTLSLARILDNFSPASKERGRDRVAARIDQLVSIRRRGEDEGYELSPAEVSLIESLTSRLYRERVICNDDPAWDTIATRAADAFVARFRARLGAS